MPDLIKQQQQKKKKKDEVEQRLRGTDTGTGSSTPKTTPAKTTTPKVQKPGVKKTITPTTNTRTTDTGTGSGNTSYIKKEKATQNAKTATRKRAQLNTGAIDTATARKQAEDSYELAKTFADSGQSSAYRNYVAREKARQYRDAVDKNALNEAIAAEQRKDRLRTWDLDKARNDRDMMRQEAEAAKFGIHQLTNQMNSAAAAGDHATVLRLNQQIQTLREQISRYEGMNNDYQEALSLQWQEKGDAFLSDLDKTNHADWANIDLVARSKVFGIDNVTGNLAALSVGLMTPEDAVNDTVDDAAVEEALKNLRAAGYKPDDIDLYIEWRKRQIESERTRDMIAAAQQLTSDDLFSASMGGRILNAFSGGGAYSALADNLAGRPVDYNSSAMMPAIVNNAMLRQAGEDIQKNNPGVGGQVLSELYQLGMSSIDSKVNQAAALVGIPQPLALAVMASNAASAGMLQAHERGLSDDQVVATGLVTGLAEYVTESVKLTSLAEIFEKSGDLKKLPLGKILTGVGRDYISQAIEEGEEEIWSDIINLVYDVYANGDKSEFRMAIQDYMSTGLTEEEATQKAVADQVLETLKSGLGGMIMGGMAGGGASIVNSVRNSETANKFRMGMSTAEGTQAHIAAEAFQEVVEQINEKSEEEITPQDHMAYQAALDQLTEAIDAMSPEETKIAKQKAKQIKAAESAMIKASKAVKKGPNKNAGKTVFSENATVQQAAELVATGKKSNTPKAVNAVLRSPEAQSALGLTFSEGTDNTSKRTQINKALHDLVQSGGPQTTEVQAQAQDQAQTQTQVQAQDDATTVVPDQIGGRTYEDFAKALRSVPGRENTTDSEALMLWKQFVSDHLVSPDGSVRSRQQFVEEYLARDPNATAAYANGLFDQMRRVMTEALAKQDGTQYTASEDDAQGNTRQGVKKQGSTGTTTKDGAVSAPEESGAKAEARQDTADTGNTRQRTRKKGATNATTKTTEEGRSEDGQKTEKSPRRQRKTKQTGSAEPAGQRAESDDNGLDGRSNVGEPGDRGGNRQGKQGDVAQTSGRDSGRGSPDSGGRQAKSKSRGRVQGAVSGTRQTNKAGDNRGSAENTGENQRTLGQKTGNGETTGRGKSGAKRGINAAAADQIHELNLKATEVMVKGAAAPMQIVDTADLPRRYQTLADEAKRMGLSVHYMLGYFTPEGGTPKPAYVDIDTRDAYISIDNEYASVGTLYGHETGHHLISVDSKLWGDLLQALEDKADTEYDQLMAYAQEFYSRYEKYYGTITYDNVDLFIEEMLCDIKAGRIDTSFPRVPYNRMRKAILPVFAQAQADAEQRVASGEQLRRYFDFDEDDVPEWAYEDDGSYDEDDEIYEDVLPEDKHEDVETGSWEETGDAEENGSYYLDPGKEDEAPSGLSPEDVIYDPERMAYYDRATGKLVFYDANDTQTFLYDEFAEIFGDEKTPDAPDYEEPGRYRDLHRAPGWTGEETAASDLKPTSTNSKEFRKWFKDPTKGKELTRGGKGRQPKELFHGTVSAGFTQFLNTHGVSSISGGIYVTDDRATAEVYAKKRDMERVPREFKPIVAKSWQEAVHFTRKDLGMRLEQEDDDSYTLYSYDEKTKMFQERGTFPATEEGLAQFNESYGRLHTEGNVETPGVVRFYGTATKALVIDAHGRQWNHVLYDPVGRAITTDGERPEGHWWTTDNIVDRAFASGYDCVIVKNVDDGAGPLNNDYIFKDPGQLKSVYNTGSWDRNNSDFRYFDEDEMAYADDHLAVLYDEDTGEFYFDNRVYEDEDAFIEAAEEFESDYEPWELDLIKNSLKNLGFDPEQFFPAQRPRKDKAELIPLMRRGTRATGKNTPGYSEAYGNGYERGLDFGQVIYDPAYDSEEYSTPFFETSTGKPVYYDDSVQLFRYDEVRELLGQEDPNLVKALDSESHFDDFGEDVYRDWADEPENADRIPDRRLYGVTDRMRESARRGNRQVDLGTYSRNLFKWFNDPTATRELTDRSGMPRILYQGTLTAGYTQIDKTKLRRRGIFTSPDMATAASYGGATEFIPEVLTSWEHAEQYLSATFGFQLVKDGDNYEVYSPNVAKKNDLLATFPATEEGLQELNASYGDLYQKSNVRNPGLYRFYGTSQKAFVLDLGYGEGWQNILFNPNGYTANPLTKHRSTSEYYWDTDDLADFLFAQGYDCLIVKNVADGGGYDNVDYIFKDPGQVKSIYNTGTWDRNNPDFRYATDEGDYIEPPEYSFDEQVDLTLAGALDDHVMGVVEEGKSRQTSVYVSYETPAILRDAKMGDLPLLITQRHIQDINHPRKEDSSGRAEPGNSRYHGIPASTIKRLPELIAEPAMIIRGTGAKSDSIIVVTTAKDPKGRQIIVPIQPNGTAIYDGVQGPANFVTSAYGYGHRPNNIRGFIELAATQGRVIFADKAKSQAIMYPHGAGRQNAAPNTSARGGSKLPPRAPGNGSRTHNWQAFDKLDFDKIIQPIANPVNPPLQRRFAEEDPNIQSGMPDSFESLLAKAKAAYDQMLSESGEPPQAPAAPPTQIDDVMMAWIIARTRYGAIEQTGTNFRKVEVPVSTDGKTKVSKTASTVMGAEITGDDRLKQIASAVVGGKLSHVPIKDKLAENRARAKIQRLGFQEARSGWTKDVTEGKVNKELVAMGATLLNNASNSNASGQEYVGILTDYADLLRRAGQALQAAKLLKTLSPEAQLYTAQRQADRVNEELTKRGFDPTQYPNVEIDPDLVDAFRRAKTDEERNRIMDQIAQNIADQIPPTFMDKFTAWRYLAMLGNIKTQVRNVVGNSLMQPMRMLKADIAGLTEALISRLGGNIERTTSVARDVATFQFAREDFDNVRDIILTGGKFDDNRRFAREIEERRRIFKSKLLEGYRKLTNRVMDGGDAVFCSFTYADALSRFMAANHTTWENASEELRDRGREIAIREAAEATYRDSNAFANFICSLRVRNPDNAVKKVASAVVEGVLPFRKTPADILARSVEYSPVGLLYSGYEAAAKALGKSKVTGTDIVNHMAKGLTGTGLLALGFALSALGLLVGKAPDDDKDKEQWKREGHQAYALEFAGHSFTLDWAAPVCVPLFLGANLEEAMLSEGLTLETSLNALRTISDPVLEMSMLQGIQSLIDNAANYGDDSALVRLTTDAMWSFASQVVPTWLGQVNRTIKGKRMQTYTDKNSPLPTDLQYALGKLSAKVPFTHYAQIMYTDAWGRTQDNADSLTWDIIQQFFSPAYFSTLKNSSMEKELTRLRKATGDSGVLISNATKSIEYTWKDADGNSHNEKKDLTGDEYLSYNTTRGQIAWRVMTNLTESDQYKALSDSDKAEAVKRVYSYATAYAKNKVEPKYELESWVLSAQDADLDFGWSEAEFIMNYLKYGSSLFNRSNSNYEKTKTAVQAGISLDLYSDLKANASTDGNTNISQAEAKAYLDSTNLSRADKSLLWGLINSGWKTNPYK